MSISPWTASLALVVSCSCAFACSGDVDQAPERQVPSQGGAGGSHSSQSGGTRAAGGSDGTSGSGGARPGGGGALAAGGRVPSVGGTGSSGGGSSAGGSSGGAGGAAACTEIESVSVNDSELGAGAQEFAYAGSWSTSTGDGKFLRDDHYTDATSASATLRFEGTAVALRSARAPHHGVLSVSVDGAAPVDVDLYGAARAEDVVVWSSGPLAPGEHELLVTAAGRKSDASTGTTVAIDRAVIERPACDEPGAGGAASAGGAAGGGGAPAAGGAPSSGGTAPAAGGASNPPVRDTMYVDGRHLYTPCGEKVVLRGVNHPTIYVDRAGAAIPEIAKTGANAARLFWFATHGVSIDEADGVISRTIASGMIPILEMHDATGPGSWGQMSAIVSYWTSSASVALFRKYRSRLILNVANEAGPNGGQDYAGFESTYRDAITRIRNAGIEVPIMIDASGWGRDYEVLFQRGPALVSHDPLHNVILSAHLYDVMSRQQLAGVYQRAVDANLPLIVGEFANKSPVGTCGPTLDHSALIGEANAREIGWLAWSWGDNDASTWWNGDCWEFDMTTTFSYDSLERWGREVAITDANSIQNTAVRPASLLSGACP